MIFKSSDGNITEWTIVSSDRRQAAGLVAGKLVIPNWPSEIYTPKGLDPDRRYHFTNVSQTVNILEYGELINTLSPVHIKNGSLVHKAVAKAIKMPGEIEDYTTYGDVLIAGVRLKPAYSGTGVGEETRHWGDFSSRMYLMTEIDVK